MLEQPQQNLPFACSVIITERNGQPAIELRRVTTDMEIIKTIVWCAMNNRDVIIRPSFTDTYKSLGSLIEKGVVYKNKETGLYHFTV